MAGLWPWLAVAGLGALHGLNPASGWPFAAARSLRSQGRVRALRALGPIAAGHLLSVALVGAVVALGLALDRWLLQAVAGAALLGVAALHLGGRRAHTAPAGLVLRSFIMSTAHGAGLMLVPALIPLCFGDAPAREITASGSLTLALLAVGVHTVAMLDVTALIATGACRGVDAVRRHGLRPLAIAALAGRGGAPASEEPFTEALSTRRE